MSLPKNIFPQIIAGGDNNDPDPRHQSNQKLLSPLEHGQDVSLDHLAFSPLSINPSGFNQQQFHGALDPGSLVYVMKQMGQTQGLALGQGNDIFSGQGNLLGQTAQELFKRTINVNIHPDIQDSSDRGAKIRAIQEKGKQHSHSLLQGLATHAAWWAMSGWRAPQLQNVPTAKQAFDNLLNGDQLSAMAGTLMNLGQMFQGLLSSISTTQGSNGDASNAGLGPSQYLTLNTHGSSLNVGESKIIGGQFYVVHGPLETSSNTGISLLPVQHLMTFGPALANVYTLASTSNVANLKITSNTVLISNHVANVGSQPLINTSTSTFSSSSNSHYGIQTTIDNRDPDQEVITITQGERQNTVDPITGLVTSISNLTTTTITTSIETPFYDTVYSNTSFKRGKGLARYNALHKGNTKLVPRFKTTVSASAIEVNPTTPSATLPCNGCGTSNSVSTQVSSTTTVDANTGNVTTTRVKTHIKNIQQKTVQNFTGSYASYYGANSDITRMDVIFQNVPAPVQDALNSISLLLQGGSAGGGGSYTTTNRVHLETYLDNAADLLSNVTDIPSLLGTLQQLYSDSSLFGADQLQPVITLSNTAWGMANTYTYANGYSYVSYADSNVSNTIATALSSMMSSSQSPSSGGGNMFGGSASTLSDMLSRLPPQAQQFGNQLNQLLNQGQNAQGLWKIVSQTFQAGSNPSDPNNFQ